MSLAVSRGQGDRSSPSPSPSRPRDRRPQDEREPSYVYPEDDLPPPRRSDAASTSASRGLPYPYEGGIHSMLPPSPSAHTYGNGPSSYRAASPGRAARDRGGGSSAYRPDDDYGDHRRASYRAAGPDGLGPPSGAYDDRRARPDPASSRGRYGDGSSIDDKLKYLPQRYASQQQQQQPPPPQQQQDGYQATSRYGGRRDAVDPRASTEHHDEDLAYGRSPSPLPSRAGVGATYGSYLVGSRWEHDGASRSNLDAGAADDHAFRRPTSPAVDVQGGPRSSRRSLYLDGRRSPGPSSALADSRQRDRSHDGRRDRSPGPASLVATDSHRRERDRSTDGRSSSRRDKSPQPPSSRMATLAVDSGRSSHTSLSAAPPSPLMESYRGTYQEVSPMPSPLLAASHGPYGDPHAAQVLSPSSPGPEGEGKKRSRRARFFDAEDVAERLARALKGTKPPDTEPLIEILPGLTQEQVMEVRSEYKRLVKTGTHHKGVNVAKHIRARLKDQDPNLMKACYAVALGMWESEAYWANFWYQGDKTRRELLIEALMGRTNDEIRQIKAGFKDKKYDDSLTRCMKTELKEDKFKKAVLMVLDERRMEEFDHHGRLLPIDDDLVDQDVAQLHKAVKADKGGETAMMTIVVLRSDSHLRCVLKEYESQYHANFARESLKKSGNLVGELLAHILNGVINRPVRDALLLHHAATASRKDELRRELLISRLVRCHWDAAYMQSVKKAFRDRYGRDLQDVVKETSTAKWGVFCEELCIARAPNDVRRLQSSEKVH